MAGKGREPTGEDSDGTVDAVGYRLIDLPSPNDMVAKSTDSC